MELFYATMIDLKNHRRKEELLKIHKKLVDYFSDDAFSDSDNKKWEDYFYKFAWAAAIGRERYFKNLKS